MLIPALRPCPLHTWYCPPVHSAPCNSLPLTHSVSYNWVFLMLSPLPGGIYPHGILEYPLALLSSSVSSSGLGSDITFSQEDLPGAFPCIPTGPPLPQSAHAAFEWPPGISVPSLDCALHQGQRQVPSTQQGVPPRGGTQGMFGK